MSTVIEQADLIVKHDSPDRDLMKAYTRRLLEGNVIDCPVRHRFIKDAYIRECFVPAGTQFITKIHRTQHLLTILQGEFDMFVDGRVVRIKAPFSCVTEPGTQRAIKAITDVVGQTYHANPKNITDIDEMEAHLIADSDEAIDVDANRTDVIEFITGDTKLLEGMSCHLLE